MIRTLLLASLLFACIAVTAGSEAAGGNTTSMIAYEREDGIWVANADGSGSRKIAEGNLGEISPDGTRVAFNSNGPGKEVIRHLEIAEVVSGKVSRIGGIPSDNSFGPVWSPDGKALLFSVYMDRDWQLARVGADGSGFRVVLHADKKNHSYYAPCWAPDGMSFYAHDLEEIGQFDLNGKLLRKWTLTTLVENGGMNSGSRMSVSPDGKSMLIDLDMDEPDDPNRTNWDGPPPAVWLLDLQAGKVRRITAPGHFAWDPFWMGAGRFLFISQGPKEDAPSVYAGSPANSKDYTLIAKGARTPSASR